MKNENSLIVPYYLNKTIQMVTYPVKMAKNILWRTDSAIILRTRKNKYIFLKSAESYLKKLI